MYPPIVALAMATVAWIPPVPLRFLLGVLEIALLIFSLRRCAIDQRVERWGILFFAAPIFISVVGIQNTAFSIALTVLLRALLQSGRMFGTGMLAGLLFYKPQIGVIVGTFVAMGKGYAFLAGLVVSLLLQYAAGVLVCKGDWLVPWVERITSFSPLRSHLDGYQMTGVIGHLPLEGVLGLPLQTWELAVCTLYMGVFLVASWWLRHSIERWNQLFTLLLITFPVFVPQTMFYDLGISIFWLVVTANLSSRRMIWRAIEAVVLVDVCFLFRSHTFSLIPLGALLVAALGVAQNSRLNSRLSRRPAEASYPRPA
jgi:hypothetical protein